MENHGMYTGHLKDTWNAVSDFVEVVTKELQLHRKAMKEFLAKPMA